MQAFNLPFWTFVGVIAGIYTILSLGLFVQFAMAGLPNFGHVAFMALAAYTMAILVIRLSVPMWLAALAGLLAAVAFGCGPITWPSSPSPAVRSSASWR
jgi:branched-chain amino acid transport system permease protein